MSFKISDSVLKKYMGRDKDVAVPDTVTSIGDEAFARSGSLTSITIPDSVTSIGKAAFLRCENLISVTIPDGVMSIEDRAFLSCKSLTSIIIPNSVRGIRRSAFENCSNLTSISIPDGVTSIGERAFADCKSLESIAIPSSVRSIGRNAFENCIRLKSIAIPNSVTSIDHATFRNCGSLMSVTIPDSVTSIGIGAFENCNSLTDISIPNTVTSIGIGAFENCSNLTEITIPDSVTSIERRAFENCNGLTNITIPNRVTGIEEKVFYNCSGLTSIAIPDGVTRIGDSAFENCRNLTSITIPDSVKSVGFHAFRGCKSLVSENGLLIISNVLYDVLNISEENIVIPDGVTSIGQDAFSCCYNLTSIMIPDSVTSIGRHAFMSCGKLTTVNIPERLTHLGEGAFKRCNNLKDICLPGALTAIPSEAFSGCDQLKRVEFSERLYAFEKNSFVDGTTIIVREDLLKTTDILPTALPNYLEKTADETCGWLLAFQTGRGWLTYLENTVQNPEKVLLEAIEHWRNVRRKLLAGNAKQIAEMAMRWGRKLNAEAINEVLAFMEEKSPSIAARLRENPAFLPDDAELHPIEKEVQKYTVPIQPVVSKIVKRGLPYADRGGLSSKEAVLACLNEYALLFSEYARDVQGDIMLVKVLKNGHEIGKSNIGDKIAAALNRNELLMLLKKLAHGRDYRSFILAYAHWAGEAEIVELASEIHKMSHGKAQERYWAENVHEALFLSNTQAAMEYFDKSNDLERYAQMKGMSAQDLRDTLMIPDFGFDTDGIKRYNIRGNCFEVSVSPELQLHLFDVAKQKEIQSFPKQSDHSDKEICAESFAVFKKKVQSFVEERIVLLKKLHMSGERIRSELWHEVYCTHAVLRHVTPLLVWQDDNDVAFMLINGSIINCDMQAYTPVGSVRVAHVMNMKTHEVSKWQQILVQNGVKQPFEQVWEPVIQWNSENLRNRYNGVVFTKQERNALKIALEQRGVKVQAEEMERKWNNRSGQYDFSNKGALLFGRSLRVEYEVDPDSGKTTFLKLGILGNKNKNEMNAVFFEFDRLAVLTHVKMDMDETLGSEILDQFTIAQISEFLNAAIDGKCHKCTALLINYKNDHFPDFADVNEFTLD